jgi:hypothetical protein
MFDTLPTIQLFPFNVKFFGNLRSKSALFLRPDARDSANQGAGACLKATIPDRGACGCIFGFSQREGQDNPWVLEIIRQ